MNTPPASCNLIHLAHCLGRPVQYGWLPLCIADACLLLAADRADLADADLTDVWRGLRGALRQAVLS